MQPVVVKATFGFLIALEIIFFGLFFLFLCQRATPDIKHLQPLSDKGNFSVITVSQFHAANLLYAKEYPVFQNVHVMIFIGFGFLMTYLKKYGRSSVGFSFLLSSFVIIWYLIIDGLIYMVDKKINITMWSLTRAELAAATFLVSFGAVFGKYNILQYYLMAFIETPIYAANRYLVEEVIMAADAGGSMVVHLFGACFGLGISLIHGVRGGPKEYRTPLEKSSYSSDISTMIGTFFLCVFWPCFNAALTVGPQQQMSAIVNTYIALASGSFGVATAVFGINIGRRNWKFDLIVVQQGILAAGVSIAATANILFLPAIAFCSGIIGAEVSSLSFYQFKGVMAGKLRMHDTRGVLSFHGLPGIMGGLVGVIHIFFAEKIIYGKDLYVIYPAMLPSGKARSKFMQGVFQAVPIFSSMGLGVAGGLLTGALMVLPIPNLTHEEYYLDETHWESYEN